MNTLAKALLVSLLACSTALAAPASEKSVKELLAVTQARRLIDNVRSQMDTQMDAVIKQALADKKPTEKQQKAINRMRDRMTALMRSEVLSWEKFEPIILRIYMEALTEDEVKGMVAFYKTPSGQAVINKMPIIIQKTTQEMPKLFSTILPQLQKIQQDFAADLQAAEAK